jgi:hypothetical protein
MRCVPDPTITASDADRSPWASARDSALVIQRLDPSAAAIRPSSDAPNFQMTTGWVPLMPTSPAQVD